MRVLQIAPHPRSHSGIAAFALELRRSLPAFDVEVDPLLVGPEPRFTWREVRRFTAAACDAARDRHDAVHVELGGGALHEFYAARALCASGHAVFLTIHDAPRPVWTPFQTQLVRNRRGLRVAAQAMLEAPGRGLERRLVRASRGIFTLSRHGLDAIEDAYGPAVAASGRAIPYPVAPRLPPTANGEGPAGGQSLTVGFFGHWYPGKGLDSLVRAVEDIAADAEPVRARLWGTGWGAEAHAPASRYRDRIVALIERSPARGLMELGGFLAEDALGAELRSCDVVVLPFERRMGKRGLTSASASLFDALSTGTPVVATDARALAEFVDHGRNGLLVAPGDDRALADALRRLRDDPALRARLSNGARESARSRSPARTAEAVVAHYRRRLA